MRRAKGRRPAPAADYPVDFAELRGWMPRGPQRGQAFRGWAVHAEKAPGVDVPVTIVPGYRQIVREPPAPAR